MIDNVNITVLPLVKANRIGHTFAVSFHTDNTSDLEFHWYEKANKEYEIGNPANSEPVYNEVDKWADMYEWAGSYSSRSRISNLIQSSPQVTSAPASSSLAKTARILSGSVL